MNDATIKRLKLSEWAERTYTETSRPCVETLRSMASRGDIPGALQIGGRWFVDVAPVAMTTDDIIRMSLDNDPELLKAAGL